MTETNASRPESLPLDDPRLLAFLPMVYVAWADGDLDPEEMRAICQAVSGNEELELGCQELFGRWLDPSRPPTPQDLNRLLRRIRRGARHLQAEQRLSLAELGLELAKADGRVVAAERAALEKLEEFLGLADAGHEITQELLIVARPAEVEVPARQPTLDVEALQLILDGKQRKIRQRIRALLSQPEFAYRYGLDRQAYRELTLDWCQRLADEGIGGLAFPTQYGGQGDYEQFIAAFETLAFHDLSLLVKFGVQNGLFGGSIYQLGTQRHHERYLAKVASLELPGCFAMTETGHGSNIREIETTATYLPDSQEFEIHTPNEAARKDYIGNAALHGQLATVFAQLQVGEEEFGVHAFLVPIRTTGGETVTGVRLEDCGEKLGLDGVDNGRLWFDQVRIPRENLLDRFGQVAADGIYSSSIPSAGKRFFTMLGTLVGGRVSVALAGLSCAKSALAIAVRYGDRRRQFGPPGEPEITLLDYRSHQRRLLPRLATTYALDFALKHLVDRFVNSEDDGRQDVEALAAGLKAMSTWHATDTIQTCREACGGQGYLAENRFAALKADSDVFATFEGDNTVLLQLVAKSLLSGYKRQFQDMNVVGVVRYLADRAATLVTELNPVVVRNTSEEHLRGDEFQLEAFRWREEHLLATVARRLKKRIDDKMPTHRALIECQDHLLETAKAHVERVVLEKFIAGATGVAGSELKSVLESLVDLFALSRIAADRGWFQEHGYIESAKAKAIRRQLNRLCVELRPDAVDLVDAFGIPDALLGAPIAQPGG